MIFRRSEQPVDHQKVFVIWLSVMNLLPALGVYFYDWPGNIVIYFYWAECALLTAFTLVFYAKRLIVFITLLLTAIFIASMASEPPSGSLMMTITFWGFYYFCWLGYIELNHRYFWHKTHRLHPLQRFLLYLVFMTLAIAVCFSLTITLYDMWDGVANIPKSIYIVFFTMAAAVPTTALGMLKIIDMIGAKHFVHFLLGTYHRPVKRERVVLFLDMVGSTDMAEKLGPEKSMDMLIQFIFDASAIIRRRGGDILNYTGDGLVVLWPIKQAEKSIEATQALREHINDTSNMYQRKFNIVPDFRVGIHAGTIVIGQIGEEKLFLGLYGDVVNTAARLEQMNKETGTKILISGIVSDKLPLPQQEQLQSLGQKEIRGKEEKIDVYTVREAA